MSTHILADMEKMCDHVGFLTEGVIKKHLSIKELDRGGNYISVSLGDNEADVEFLKTTELPYELTSDGTVRFRLEDDRDCKKQKVLFQHLAGLNVKIESIHSEVDTLDKIFREVCN